MLDDIVPVKNPQVPLADYEMESVSVITSVCRDYVQNMTEQFIFGTESLDTWDDYVKVLESNGCNTILELYNN